MKTSVLSNCSLECEYERTEEVTLPPRPAPRNPEDKEKGMWSRGMNCPAWLYLEMFRQTA